MFRRFISLIVAMALAVTGFTFAASPASAAVTMTLVSYGPSQWTGGTSVQETIVWTDSYSKSARDTGQTVSVELEWDWTVASTFTAKSENASFSGSTFTCPSTGITFSGFGLTGTSAGLGQPPQCVYRPANSGNPVRVVELKDGSSSSDWFTYVGGSTITVTIPQGVVTASTTPRSNYRWTVTSFLGANSTPNPNYAFLTFSVPGVDSDGNPIPLVTINIDSNGGTCRTTQVTGYQGTWVLAPDGNNCNKLGRFLFQGYNTSPDGTGLAIAPGGNLNLTGDNTLYAIYYAPRAPGAPTDVVAVGGRNSVSVSWKPPADLGAPAGASYVAQASPNGARCSVSRDTQPNADGRLGCTISVPAGQTLVDVSVKADNFFATSAASTPSNKVRSFDLILETVERPKAGVFARLFKGEGSTVSFTGRAPGAAGSKFTPQLKIGNGEWTSEPSGDLKVGEKGNLEWSKVLNKKLDKQAVAVRFAIAGQVSNEYTAEIGKTVGLPSAPRDVKLKAGLGEYTVSWNPPAKDGGSAVTSYVVTSDLRRFNCTVKAPETSCKISLGTSFATGPVELSVRAVSARGEGKAAKATGNVVYRWIQPLSVTTYPVGDRETEINVLFYSDGLTEKQATVELRIGKEGKWKKYGSPEPVNRPNRMYWSGILGANAQNQPIFIRVSTPYGDTRIRQVR